MNKLKLVLTVVLVFIAGYAVGNFLPFSGFSFSSMFAKDIRGSDTLEVKLIMDNGLPLENVEVDLGEQAGPPAKGGMAVTNNDGVATFLVRPGNYVIFFNTNNFPKNVNMPELQQVVVEQGEINKMTMKLTVKQKEKTSDVH